MYNVLTIRMIKCADHALFKKCLRYAYANKNIFSVFHCHIEEVWNLFNNIHTQSCLVTCYITYTLAKNFGNNAFSSHFFYIFVVLGICHTLMINGIKADKTELLLQQNIWKTSTNFLYTDCLPPPLSLLPLFFIKQLLTNLKLKVEFKKSKMD